MTGAGVAVTLCAILNGVEPQELMADEDPYLDMSEPYQFHRILYSVNSSTSSSNGTNTTGTNTTGTTGLDAGAITGISIGAVLLGLLLLAALWWWCSQSRSGMPQHAGYSRAFNPTPEYALPDAGRSSMMFANMAGADELSTLTISMNRSSSRTDEPFVGIPLLSLGKKR